MATNRNQKRAAPPSPPQISEVFPSEIIDVILLKFPVKSLVLLSCTSKFWNSKIFNPSFIRKHINSPALFHKRVVIHKTPFRSSLSAPLSSISDLRRFGDEPSIVSPFGDARVKLKAFCEELWCVQVEQSLYLWNPCTGSRREIPADPAAPTEADSRIVYGLAYDAATDDYKLLKVWRVPYSARGTSVYSLRENRWREVEDKYFPWTCIPSTNGEFVNGAFHWIVTNSDDWHSFLDRTSSFISFDLATEKYKEMPQPPYSPPPSSDDDVGVAVLKGLLCVYLNYSKIHRFVLWSMKDYGAEKSWTKMYEIRYDTVPSIAQMIMEGRSIRLRPLYLHENGELLIWFHGVGRKDSTMVVFRDGEVVAQQNVVGGGGGSSRGGRRRTGIPAGGFVYVESHVSLERRAIL